MEEAREANLVSKNPELTKGWELDPEEAENVVGGSDAWNEQSRVEGKDRCTAVASREESYSAGGAHCLSHRLWVLVVYTLAVWGCIIMVSASKWRVCPNGKHVYIQFQKTKALCDSIRYVDDEENSISCSTAGNDVLSLAGKFI